MRASSAHSPALATAVVIAGFVLTACTNGGSAATSRPAAAPAAATASPGVTAGPTMSAGASATSDGAGEVVLIAVGDVGRCDSTGDDETGALAASLPGTVAILGDTAYESGSAAELERCFGESWGVVEDRIRYAATGNHDIKTDDGAPLKAYLGDAVSRDGRTWFSDDLGAWHLIVLDSNCGLLQGACSSSSAQVRWLREDLAASDARCTLAMWHHPRFSSGYHGNSSSVGAFWDALHDAGAELVLNGHEHDYERFEPQDPGGQADPVGGLTEIVAGTGGGALKPFERSAPNSLVRIADTYGVLELTLRSSSWSYRFLATDGRVLDQGDGTCH
jgi:acid phosphatase type 7